MWFLSNLLVSPAFRSKVCPTAMFTDEYQRQNEDYEKEDDHGNDHDGKPRVGDVISVLVMVFITASPVAKG
jgi:hypothetical protein